MGKIEAFKRAFQKKLGSTEFNIGARLTKVRTAVDEMEDWTKHLESLNNPGAPAARAQLQGFRSKIALAEPMAASTGSKSALSPVKAKVQKDMFEQLAQVKDDARAACKAARIAAKKTPFLPDPDGTGPVKVYMSDIPGFAEMGAAAPNGGQSEQEQAIELAARKVNAGREQFDALMAMSDDEMDALPPPDAKTITELAWFLKNKGQEKVDQPWERGAMTIPDPGGKLGRYLKRSPEGYTRGSSHLTDQQKAKEGTAWGIDFYEGVGAGGKPDDADRLLPGGMRTMLIQEVRTGKERRLYIKMETESARLDPQAPIRGLKDLKRGTERDDPKSRAFIAADIGRSIEHGKNLVKSKLKLSQGDDKELMGFREKIIDEIKDAYKDLCKLAAKSNPVIAKKLKDGGKHLYQMFDALNDVASKPDLLDAVLLQSVRDTTDAIMDLLAQDSYDTELDSRFGGEVALSVADLAPLPRNIDADEDDDATIISDEEDDEDEGSSSSGSSRRASLRKGKERVEV